MAKPRGTVDLYTTTRDLLKQIIAMPGNGRSQPAMLDNLVHDEGVRLGLIEGPRTANLDERACCKSFSNDEGECPECGDDLRVDLVGGTKHCTNPARD